MSGKTPAPSTKTLNGSDIDKDKSALAECFVIMPISDQQGYDAGHFTKVYEDIFKPACASAGYAATRADDVKESNLIHLDILKRVVHSPMAICDLSSRNPNVLFELGLRQAFDKPTILVKDKETPEIFDIAPIRYTSYRQSLRYREVLKDQQAISRALKATKEAIGQEHNVNSLIKLLELAGPAQITENRQGDSQDYFGILMAEITQLKQEVRNNRTSSSRPAPLRAPTPAIPSIIAKASIIRAKVAVIEGQFKAGTVNDSTRRQIKEVIDSADAFLEKYGVATPDDPNLSHLLQIASDVEGLRLLSQL
jgi:hypothetical protein